MVIKLAHIKCIKN